MKKLSVILLSTTWEHLFHFLWGLKYNGITQNSKITSNVTFRTASYTFVNRLTIEFLSKDREFAKERISPLKVDFDHIILNALLKRSAS